jgi:hypothetical protein
MTDLEASGVIGAWIARTSMLRGVYVAERGPGLPAELLTAPARHGYRTGEFDTDCLERIGNTTPPRLRALCGSFGERRPPPGGVGRRFANA